MNSSFKILSLLLIMFFITGCGTKTVTPPAPKQAVVEKPEIGVPHTVGIGETLLVKMNVYEFYGVELKERLTDGGRVREYIMEPHVLPYIDTTPEGNKRFLASQDYYYVNDKLVNRRIPLRNNFLIVDKELGQVSMTGYYDLTNAGRPSNQYPDIEIGNQIDIKRSNFKQELIYNGRSSSTVRFLYREFGGEMIRADFNQDLMYDLNESSEIGFRRVRIEIIDATNSSITYKVLSSF